MATAQAVDEVSKFSGKTRKKTSVFWKNVPEKEQHKNVQVPGVISGLSKNAKRSYEATKRVQVVQKSKSDSAIWNRRRGDVLAPDKQVKKDNKLVEDTTEISAIHATSTSSLSESGQVSRRASLKTLNVEDKKRVANLIKELAKTGEERELALERLQEERMSFEEQLNAVHTEQKKLKEERESLKTRLEESEQLLKKYKDDLKNIKSRNEDEKKKELMAQPQSTQTSPFLEETCNSDGRRSKMEKELSQVPQNLRGNETRSGYIESGNHTAVPTQGGGRRHWGPPPLPVYTNKLFDMKVSNVAHVQTQNAANEEEQYSGVGDSSGSLHELYLKEYAMQLRLQEQQIEIQRQQVQLQQQLQMLQQQQHLQQQHVMKQQNHNLLPDTVTTTQPHEQHVLQKGAEQPVGQSLSNNDIATQQREHHVLRDEGTEPQRNDSDRETLDQPQSNDKRRLHDGHLRQSTVELRSSTKKNESVFQPASPKQQSNVSPDRRSNDTRLQTSDSRPNKGHRSHHNHDGNAVVSSPKQVRKLSSSRESDITHSYGARDARRYGKDGSTSRQLTEYPSQEFLEHHHGDYYSERKKEMNFPESRSPWKHHYDVHEVDGNNNFHSNTDARHDGGAHQSRESYKQRHVIHSSRSPRKQFRHNVEAQDHGDVTRGYDGSHYVSRHAHECSSEENDVYCDTHNRRANNHHSELLRRRNRSYTLQSQHHSSHHDDEIIPGKHTKHYELAREYSKGYHVPEMRYQRAPQFYDRFVDSELNTRHPDETEIRSTEKINRRHHKVSHSRKQFLHHNDHFHHSEFSSDQTSHDEEVLPHGNDNLPRDVGHVHKTSFDIEQRHFQQHQLPTRYDTAAIRESLPVSLKTHPRFQATDNPPSDTSKETLDDYIHNHLGYNHYKATVNDGGESAIVTHLHQRKLNDKQPGFDVYNVRATTRTGNRHIRFEDEEGDAAGYLLYNPITHDRPPTHREEDTTLKRCSRRSFPNSLVEIVEDLEMSSEYDEEYRVEPRECSTLEDEKEQNSYESDVEESLVLDNIFFLKR